MNIEELKKMNVKFKNQIRNTLLRIGKLIEKKNNLDKYKDNLQLSAETNYLENNLILNDLPDKQQISIFRESILELKKKIEKIENKTKFIIYNNKQADIFSFTHLKNEIKKKKEQLYYLNHDNDILQKVIKSNDENYNYYLINNDLKQIINQLKEEINHKKEELKTKKNEEKEGEILLKKLNKDINNLEMNIQIIKDNIKYKKELDKKNITIQEKKLNQKKEIKSIQDKLNNIQIIMNEDKIAYHNILQTQREKINSLFQFIQSIEDNYRKVLNFERLNKIKELGKIRKIQIKKNDQIHQIHEKHKEKFHILPKIRTVSASHKKTRTKINMKKENLKKNYSYVLPDVNKNSLKIKKSRKLNLNKSKNFDEKNYKIPFAIYPKRSYTPINQIRKIYK